MIKVFEKGLHILFLILSVTVLAIMIEKSYLQLGTSYALVLTAIIVLGLFFIKKYHALSILNFDMKRTWLILRIISAIIMFVLLLTLHVGYNNTWDWGALIRYAYEYCTRHTVSKIDYLSRYPNNVALYFILIIICKICNVILPFESLVFFKCVTCVISYFLIQCSISLMYKAALKVYKEKVAFFFGVTVLLNLPLYLYSQFLYTDVPALFFTSLELYLLVKINFENQKKNEVLLYICLGLVAGIAAIFKITTLIIIFAYFVYLFISKVGIRKYVTIVISIFLSFSCIYLSTTTFVNYLSREKIGITEELQEKYEFPFTHWIMMGLGEGYYSQDDVDYSSSFSTIESRKAGNIKVIKERIKERGIAGTIKHEYHDKMKLLFGNSCLNGDHYVGRHPIFNNILVKIFTSNGNFHKYCLFYSWGYALLIAIGFVVKSIKLIPVKSKEKEYSAIISLTTILGFSIFTMFWESNSRYLLIFLPFVLFAGFDGLLDIYRFKIKGLNK